MPYVMRGRGSARKKVYRTSRRTTPTQTHPQAVASTAARKAGMVGGFSAQYAWFFLTNDEKVAYAAWKDTEGEYGVKQGTALPKNWYLLEKGTIEGETARQDVGVIGLHYLEGAVQSMNESGTRIIWDRWVKDIAAENDAVGELLLD